MFSYDELTARLFISFRYTLLMMEIKPEIVDRVMTHTTTVVAAKFNKQNHQVNIIIFSHFFRHFFISFFKKKVQKVLHPKIIHFLGANTSKNLYFVNWHPKKKH